VTFRLTSEQAEQALDVCALFPPRTGMYVSPVSWATVGAFWTGYASSWPDGAHRALQEFATEQLGPSNIYWGSRLYDAHNAGETREQHLCRRRVKTDPQAARRVLVNVATQGASLRLAAR
jgi:hypothetical protein